MIIEEFKLVFSSPKYIIAKREIEVSVFREKQTLKFCSDNEVFIFESGNILCSLRELVFYRILFAGKNNLNYAKKHFLKRLEQESKHSELHRQRYLKCLNDFS